MADKEKMAGVKRLLEAGHAEVVGIRDPYRKFKEATHAFIDMGKTGRRSVKMVCISRIKVTVSVIDNYQKIVIPL